MRRGRDLGDDNGMTTKKKLAAAMLVALATFACSGITDPSNNASQTFNGSVQPNNYGPVHTFDVSNVGEITVTMTQIIPNTLTGVTLGLEYGQVAGGGCGVLQRTAVSSLSLNMTAITAQVTNKGTYCVQVFDPAGLGIGYAALLVGE